MDICGSTDSDYCRQFHPKSNQYSAAMDLAHSIDLCARYHLFKRYLSAFKILLGDEFHIGTHCFRIFYYSFVLCRSVSITSLYCCLSKVTCHKASTVSFYEMSFAEDSQLLEDLADFPGDSCLPGARVSIQHHMVTRF
jgi:hypothetical protein